MLSPERMAAAADLLASGHSPMSAARCLNDVNYRQIEEAFGPVPHPPFCGHSPGFYKWLMDDCPYTWRPNNPNPEAAPWSRLPDLHATR